MAKAFLEFEDDGRIEAVTLLHRIVDVVEELVKFTLLTRDNKDFLVDRYSERVESAEEVSKRVNQNRCKVRQRRIRMGFFERYLSVWVGPCIVAGVGLGYAMPGVFASIAALEYAHVNLIVAVLIWLMIYSNDGTNRLWLN